MLIPRWCHSFLLGFVVEMVLPHTALVTGSLEMSGEVNYGYSFSICLWSQLLYPPTGLFVKCKNNEFHSCTYIFLFIYVTAVCCKSLPCPSLISTGEEESTVSGGGERTDQGTLREMVKVRLIIQWRTISRHWRILEALTTQHRATSHRWLLIIWDVANAHWVQTQGGTKVGLQVVSMRNTDCFCIIIYWLLYYFPHK